MTDRLISERSRISSAIKKSGLIAVLRGIPEEKAVFTAEALVEAGVVAAEVAFSGTDADSVLETVRIIEKLKIKFGDSLFIGAGTVTDKMQVLSAKSAGAEISVSPNTNPEVICAAAENGLVVIPGALSPTEMLTAKNAGADIIKFFPAGVMGAEFLKAVRFLVPDVPVFAFGGISPEKVSSFLDAGADGFGLASSIISKKAVEQNDFSDIKNKAQIYIRAVAVKKAQTE